MWDGKALRTHFRASEISVEQQPNFSNYKILSEIGRGRTGAVYEARDIARKRSVALKLIDTGAHTRRDEIRQIRKRIEAAANISHPNIARIYEVGEQEGLLYVARERFKRSLAEKLGGTALRPNEAADIVMRLANAMHTLHQRNFIHCDLKPNNVLFDELGTPKIADFGIATNLEDFSSLKSTEAFVDTLPYAAPEQAVGKWNKIGPGSDVYSLGAILYECLTGRPPFEAKTDVEALHQVIHDVPVPPRSLKSTVPRDLQDICLKCLEKRPGERYLTARELENDLDRWSRGEPIRASSAGLLSRGWRRTKQLFAGSASAPPHLPQHEPNEAKQQAHEETKSPRYFNVCLTRPTNHEVLFLNTSLAPDREYHLQIDIGALHPQSAVRNPERVPTELLPRTEDGHWLEVLVSSKDFIVPQRRHHLFLPREGPSWVCSCPPGNEHTCDPQARGNYVWIPVKSPIDRGSARLRLGLYYEKNLIQSQLLTAEIAEVEQEGHEYSSWIDYTLTSKLTGLGSLPPRTLNILTNENADGTHLVMVNGPDFNPVFHLTEGQMRATVDPAREALRRIHFKEYGGMAGTEKQRENLYDPKTNSKKTSDFIEDLKILAQLGQKLWLLFLEDQLEWWNVLQQPGIIQVSRVLGSRFLFPWALVYDIPLEIGAKQPYEQCKLLQNWDREKFQLVENGTRQCPYQAQHPRTNVLCPFGFWGLKHFIEQPASVPRNAKICTEIQPTNRPPELVVGLSRKLDQDLTTSHLDRIKQLQGITVRPYSSREEIKSALSKCVELVYFYCHGRQRPLPGGSEPAPYLEIGDTDEIHPEDLSTWRRELHPVNPWEKTSPLVFINGCHTVDITPESLLTFVDTFAKAQAAGVIGTEITLDQNIAGESATEFFTHFTDGKSVGEALQRMRLHLFAKNNVLGLAYTPYCSASLALIGAAN